MNKMFRQLITMLFCFGIFINAYAAVAPDNSLAPMLQKVLPAVVNIRADIKITDIATLNRLLQERNAQGGNSNTPIPDTILSIGSGVIVDPSKGYILTNAHVVSDAQNIMVTLGDGRHYSGKLIGLDKPSDVALLQITAKNLTAIPLGKPNSLKVGDPVVAIGNPFALNQTVTSGIVSALGRTQLGIEGYENFIQTDAPINLGNSGGALLNQNGELVGINTAILSPQMGSIGIGFAIPITIVKSVMDQLITFGNVKRGMLGIGAQDVTPDLVTAFKLNNVNSGAVVTLVRENSPAQKAGVNVGDVITSVNGADIKNANDVVTTVGFLRVNSKINIDLLRGNKRMTLNAVLIDPSELRTADQTIDPFFFGVGLQNFSLFSPIHGTITGIAVVSVEPDSNAWRADLRPGDVITSINQQKVSTIDDLRNIEKSATSSLLLNVLRGPGAVFLVINKEPS